MGKRFAIAIGVACLASASAAQQTPRLIGHTGQILRVEFVFDNAVRQTRDLPSRYLRSIRRTMISGAPVNATDLRALADAGDGLAAFRYAKLLQAMPNPDPKGAAAHYYSIAAYTGRAFAVPPLARMLMAEGAGYSDSRLKQALNAMTVQAISGNAVAATLLGQMYADGVPFGHDLAQAQTFLAMTSKGGSPKVALQLGIALMSDPTDASAGSPAARSALRLAAAGDDLSVRVTAENLLRLLDTLPIPEPEVTQ